MKRKNTEKLKAGDELIFKRYNPQEEGDSAILNPGDHLVFLGHTLLNEGADALHVMRTADKVTELCYPEEVKRK